MRRTTCVAAFTLVEVLAAMMFLAIAVPAILTAYSASGRNAEAAERSVLAGELAEKQLSEIIMQERAAATNGGSTSQSSGDFGTEYPGVRWELAQETWANDASLTQYTMRVFFPVRGSERSVELTTLLAGSNGSL
jgi:type II secretory pathway pseudopilin PulG